jgi:amidase
MRCSNRLAVSLLTTASMGSFLFCTASMAQERRQSFDVQEATVVSIHAALREGRVTCRQLVEIYLQRIERFDQPIGLNAIVVVNPHALERAEELDKEFRDTGRLRPLHGVPLIVKDNYDTHDLQTAAGSLALQGSLPPDDAFQVRRLREAGAIVLAKSNMAEWAYSPYYTVSSIAGVTRNPYDLTRVPAGSSGGTAAAIAANFAVLGLGTDTGNSIRGPASHCALVGIRSTIGLTSRDGIVPLFLRNDIGGPICRTVEDCARVLEAIAGYDSADPVTEKSKDKVPESYTQFLDPDGLRGARIGVFRTLSESPTTDPQIHALFEQAIADLRTAGATIVDPFEVPRLDRAKLERLQGSLWHDTFRHDIGEYLASLGPAAPVKSLEEILRSGKYHDNVHARLLSSQRARVPRLERPYSADPADDPVRLELLNSVAHAMDTQHIDAFVYPTWSNPPRKLDDLDSPHGNNSPYLPPHTGQPAITVPMGFCPGDLPAGLQFVARPFAEPTLFKLAYAYEQATQHRRPPPRFTP